MPGRAPQSVDRVTPIGWIAPSMGGVRRVGTVTETQQTSSGTGGVGPGRPGPVGWQAPSPQPRARIDRVVDLGDPADSRSPSGGAGAETTRASRETDSMTGAASAGLRASDSHTGSADRTGTNDPGAGGGDVSGAGATASDSPAGGSTDDTTSDDESEPADSQHDAGGESVIRRDTSHQDDHAAVSRETPGSSEAPLAARIADEQRRRAAVHRTAVPRPPAPRVMTIANQKGGVGKTTTTVNVAAALAQSGLNVLVIDIDPQGNASTALGIPHHAEVPSIYDVITDDRPLGEVLQECPDVPGLWCAPATIDLAGAEIELVSLVARESRLKRAVDEHLATMSDDARFDYVLIDCPPSLGLLTVNAFVAAAEVFIPIQCEYYALEGLSQLLNNIGMIRRHLNPRLEVSTILLTMYDGRTNLSSNVADEVREHFPDNVLRTQIPRSVRISEAPSYGQTVLTYDPSSSGALSYLEAAKELALRTAPAPAGS